MKAFFPFLLLLLCPFVLLAQPTEFEKARTLYDEEKYEASLAILDRLLAADSSVADYYVHRGLVHQELGKPEKAFMDFTGAIQLDPFNPMHYMRRAVILYTVQMPDEAISDNTKALSLLGSKDTLRYSVLNNRGNAKAMKRDFQGAFEDYWTVYQHDSSNKAVMTNLGAVMDELGRGEEAIPILERAIRLYPDWSGGYGNLAFRYIDRGDYKKALELCNKVLELDPADPLGYNNRGHVKYKMGELEGALKDINKSLDMYPSNSYAYRNRALVHLAKKEKKKACADLAKAVEFGFTQMYGEEVEQLLKEHCK